MLINQLFVFLAHTKRSAGQEICPMPMQLSAHLQELVTARRLSTAELQTNNQFGSVACHAAGADDAGNVSVSWTENVCLVFSNSY